MSHPPSLPPSLPHPPPPPSANGNFELRNWLWNFEVDTPPQQNRNFSSGQDLENLKLTFINWFPPTNHPPPPHHWTWEFGILANFNSASKVGNWFPPTPFPHQSWKFWILANLDLASKVLEIGFHQPPPPFPTPPSDMGIWDFSKFGLSIKSWKLVSTNPHQPPIGHGIWDYSKFGLSIKSWKLVSTNPHQPPIGHGNLGL